MIKLNNRLLKSFSLILMLTMISKVLGFVREMLLASKYGAGFDTDAYLVATSIPTILFMSIGIAVRTTLIPAFTIELNNRKREEAFKLVNSIVNLCIILGIILIVLVELNLSRIIVLIAPGFSGDQLEIIIRYSRVLVPALIFIVLSDIFGGILNTFNEFKESAFIGIAYNVVIIFTILFLSDYFGMFGIVVGTLIGFISQLLILLPKIRKLGFTYHLYLNLNHPFIKNVLWKSLPVIIGSITLQLNLLIDRMFGSSLGDGAISSLNYANKINVLATSIFIASILTAQYPLFSKYYAEENISELKSSYAKTIRMLTIITIPITIVFMINGELVVKILFQRGEFTEKDVYITASVLLHYAIAIVFIGVREASNKLYFSMGDTRTPMIISISAVVINIAMNFILVPYMGVNGLALSNSIAAIYSASILTYLLNRKINGIINMIFKDSYKIMLVILISAFLCKGFESWFNISTVGNVFVFLIFPGFMVMLIGIYFSLMYVFKVEEINLIAKAVIDKLKKNEQMKGERK